MRMKTEPVTRNRLFWPTWFFAFVGALIGVWSDAEWMVAVAVFALATIALTERARAESLDLKASH